MSSSPDQSQEMELAGTKMATIGSQVNDFTSKGKRDPLVLMGKEGRLRECLRQDYPNEQFPGNADQALT